MANSASSLPLDGQDPVKAGCANNQTRTIATYPLIENQHGGNVLGQVNLRYSPTCQTKWVQVQVVGNGIQNQDLMGTIRFTGNLRRIGELPVFASESFNNPQGNTMYTDMIAASLNVPVIAEGQIDGTDRNGTQHHYFSCINESNPQDHTCPPLIHF
jgi:hypothetical protein